jgi:predicted RNA-binding protein (virulence factor B family)
LKATTEIPLAEVGEFAVMSCVQSLPSGAFMDWGIIKDFLFLQAAEIKLLKKRYLVYIYVDEDLDLLELHTKFKRNPQYQDLLSKRR